MSEDEQGAVVSPNGAEVVGLAAERVLLPSVGTIGRLAWASDSVRLAVAGPGGLALCEPGTGVVRRVCEPTEGASGIQAEVSWSPDDVHLAYADPVSVGVFRADDGQLLWRRALPEPCVAWSPRGDGIAVGTDDGRVLLLDPETGEELLALGTHEGDVMSLAWSPDGERLATAGGSRGSQDQAVRIFDIGRRALLHRMEGHQGYVADLAWSPTSPLIASVSMDQTVRVWDALGGVAVGVLHDHTSETRGVAWSPDGRILASHSWDDTVRFWNSHTLEALAVARVAPNGSQIRDRIGFSPDGRRLALSRVSQVLVWSFDADALLQGGGAAWRWRGGTASWCPVRGLDDAREAVVTHRTGWSVDGARPLEAFARWCAASVAHLWDCPEPVQQYLRTGSPAQREAALQAALRVEVPSGPSPARSAQDAALVALQLVLGAPSSREADRLTLVSLASDVIQCLVDADDTETPSVLREIREAAGIAQSIRLVSLLHAEHELQGLEPEYQALWGGPDEAHAVLRDIALQRGLSQLAGALA